MKQFLSLLSITAILACTALAGRNDSFTGNSVFESGTLSIKSGVSVTVDATSFTISAGAKTALQSALSIQPLDSDLTAIAALTTTSTGRSVLAAADAAAIRLIAGAQKNWVAVPANASASGTAGDLAYASGYLYVCVATNTWQRVAVATW